MSKFLTHLFTVLMMIVVTPVTVFFILLVALFRPYLLITALVNIFSGLQQHVENLVEYKLIFDDKKYLSEKEYNREIYQKARQLGWVGLIHLICWHGWYKLTKYYSTRTEP